MPKKIPDFLDQGPNDIKFQALQEVQIAFLGVKEVNFYDIILRFRAKDLANKQAYSDFAISRLIERLSILKATNYRLVEIYNFLEQRENIDDPKGTDFNSSIIFHFRVQEHHRKV